MSPKHLPEYLKTRLAELPQRPGVYLFKDAEGKAVYIGKALSLKKRVAGHFRFYGETGSKEGMMLSLIRRVDILETPTEGEALLLEASLIKEQLPKYNSMLKDDKSYPYLKITDEEYPRLLVVRGRKADGAKYFGPYTDVRVLRRAVEMLRKQFPLRTCRKLPKKVCLQFHLGLCGGPCEGHQSKEAYKDIALNLSRFVEGRRDALVKNLSKRMREYASKHEFERAQAMRDAMTALSAMPVSARTAGRLPDILLELQQRFELPALPRRIECFDISNIQGREAVGSMVVFVDGEPSRKDYRRFRVKTVSGIDDYSMMREVVKRRYAGSLALELPRPDVVLIDGGKGHLSAAQKALKEIGADLPLLSIAKQHEIIFSLKREAPAILPPTSPALQMLRHLRDEAHRFAITYHRRLHRREAIASELDGIPGLGGKGKEKLLKKFGTIEKIRAAGPEGLSSRSGLGPKIATRVWEALMNRQAVLLLAGLLFCATASADMIEIRGKGFLNGHIVAQDENEVQFEDSADQRVHVVPRKDVLFLEFQKDAPQPAQSVQKTAVPKAKTAAPKPKKNVVPTQGRYKAGLDTLKKARQITASEAERVKKQSEAY